MSTDDKIAHAVGIMVVALLIAAMVIVMIFRSAHVLHVRMDAMDKRVQAVESVWLHFNQDAQGNWQVRTNATPERNQ